jgi:argininosuccinate lyase
MPQKKNPDIFELTRGRSGVIFGYLQALLVIQKGLPLAYNRDLQEDKPQLFDALAKTVLTLELLALTVASVKFVPAALQRSVQDDAIFSTDILEYLVRKGMAFSEAHSLVGQMVAHASAEEKNLGELELQEFRSFTPVFDKDVYKIFDASVSVRSKKTVGSTHPANVSRELGRWATALGLRLKKK